MKQLLTLLFIISAVSLLTLPPHIEAFSECRSEKNGYCVRLDPQASFQTAKRNPMGLLFAAVVPFPGLEFLSTYGIGYDTPIGETLSGLYNFGVAIAGISALIMFTYGGIRYITSAGSSSATSDARKRMSSALFGLALIAGSYLILYTINHDFVNTLSEKTIPSLNMPNATPVPSVEPPT